MNAALVPLSRNLKIYFSSFNDHFYDGRLQKPVIIVSPNSRKVNLLGWCTSWKAWDENHGREKYVMDDSSGGYYEISICAEYLNRPFEEICGTLLHEMVHRYNAQSDIQDTCRSGLYHNKQFKRVAKEHGLIVSKDATYGFSVTHMDDEAARFVESMKDVDFQLCRKKRRSTRVAGQKSSMRKYNCSRCGLIIRATREAHVLYITCGVELKQETAK